MIVTGQCFRGKTVPWMVIRGEGPGGSGEHW